MLQLLCSHLTPDNSTLRVIGLALNLCKHSGRRVATLLTWIDFCRKHMRQTQSVMSHLGCITLLQNICRPRAGFEDVEEALKQPHPTKWDLSVWSPRREAPARTKFISQVGISGWLLWWKPSQATGCLHRQEPKGYPTAGWPACWSFHTVVSGLKKGCWDDGLDISTLELCFPVLWLIESVARQGSERLCEPSAWFLTKKVSLILIALSSSTDLKNPREMAEQKETETRWHWGSPHQGCWLRHEGGAVPPVCGFGWGNLPPPAVLPPSSIMREGITLQHTLHWHCMLTSLLFATACAILRGKQ